MSQLLHYGYKNQGQRPCFGDSAHVLGTAPIRVQTPGRCLFYN